jgi:flavin-dependent dehydrogenase
VVVVGGGPAGSFFALRLLRRARQAGRVVNVIILEKKTEICFYGPVPFSSWEGCNYCAGGVSPRLIDGLRAEGITIPEEVSESRPTEIIVHGDWKSIQLPVPEGREMVSVFRGSRPRQRTGRYVNFDTWLLNLATEEGARVITAQVESVHYSPKRKPVVSYRAPGAAPDGTAPADGAPAARARGGTAAPDTATAAQAAAGAPAVAVHTIEADFAVFAGGVNRSPGADPRTDPVLAALQKMIPRLRPPKVRKAVIAEMRDDTGRMRVIEGELHFVQYGSKDLRIEMASVMPKKEWITTVLLGKSVDRAQPQDSLGLVERFLQLPNIRRLVPPKAGLVARCCCNPNMTVGAARRPFGERVALAGDLAVARLYKDGLYSAHVTASALADCVLEEGIDEASLARRYGPVVHDLHVDNRYGRLIFRLSHGVLSRPALSRMLYRAVITERMTTPHERHRLAPALWQVASGDHTYRHALRRMIHPASLWLFLIGGLLPTIRDVVTERLFGLDWTGIPRYMTGVPLERMEPTRNALFAIQGLEPPSRAPQMEEMFTIRIRAGKEAILKQLGAFGDPDRQYLKPRFVRIERVSGMPNQVGTIIRYRVPLVRLSFSVGLEKVEPERYLLYRIVEGMGRGGILAFVLDELRPGVSLLTIYVGFDFPRGRGVGRLGWAIGRRIFPEFAHNVVWNHSLCQIRQLAELDEG